MYGIRWFTSSLLREETPMWGVVEASFFERCLAVKKEYEALTDRHKALLCIQFYVPGPSCMRWITGEWSSFEAYSALQQNSEKNSGMTAYTQGAKHSST
jgi:hypothetical protein